MLLVEYKETSGRNFPILLSGTKRSECEASLCALVPLCCFRIQTKEDCPEASCYSCLKVHETLKEEGDWLKKVRESVWWLVAINSRIHLLGSDDSSVALSLVHTGDITTYRHKHNDIKKRLIFSLCRYVLIFGSSHWNITTYRSKSLCRYVASVNQALDLFLHMGLHGIPCICLVQFFRREKLVWLVATVSRAIKKKQESSYSLGKSSSRRQLRLF